MCGIAGVLAYGGNAKVTAPVLVRMRDAMVHRGPDGGDIWMSPQRDVGLAHRRLSIVDLSSLADQPMPNENAGVWITFNGEIYNHARLRPALKSAKHVFRTDHSDTEVLVHGFEEWGIDGLLERIAGDFAFAIYDVKERALYLARDRIGVKPLYFADVGGEFVFASEIKAILEHPKIERDIDALAMVHYLSFLTSPAPMTMFKGVYKLPPGSWLKVTATGRLSMRTYYRAEPGKGIEPEEIDGVSEAALEDFYVGGVRRRLRAAVERRMMSDVPVGVFLSGGVDSSTNVALMAECSTAPVNTFTVGFKDHPELNELDYAGIAAKRFATNHREVLIDEDDMMGYLDDLLHHQDEPIADPVCIPLYFVSKLARDSGVTVVQVGEGSDEQFSGYDNYLRYLKLHRRYWTPFRSFMPRFLRTTVAAAAQRAARLHPALPKYADVVERAAYGREFFWGLSIAMWDSRKDRLVRREAIGTTDHHARMVSAGILDPGYLVPDSYNVVKSVYAQFDQKHPRSDALTRMIYHEFRMRLPELLLMRVDKIGMSVSLEPRVPFLDHELVDFTFDIPEAWKVRNGVSKYILKKAVAGIIPDELIDRKKMGFDVPMAAWLKGRFGEHVKNQIASSGLIQRGLLDLDYIREMFADHEEGRANLAQPIWTIYNLVAWYDYWIDGQRGARKLAG